MDHNGPENEIFLMKIEKLRKNPRKNLITSCVISLSVPQLISKFFMFHHISYNVNIKLKNYRPTDHTIESKFKI